MYVVNVYLTFNMVIASLYKGNMQMGAKVLDLFNCLINLTTNHCSIDTGADIVVI